MSKKNKIFFPTNKNLSELFSLDDSKEYFKFYIPDYQRQYSWVDKNLKELWDDLYDAFIKDDECYFLGSIVMVERKENDEIKFDLIDGQQRITTFVIMMDVLLKDFKDKLKEKLYNKIYSYLHPLNNEYRLILQSNPNYDTDFRNTIKNKKTFSNEHKDILTEENLKRDEPKYKYMNTAHFFYNKFNELDSEELNDFVDYIFTKSNVIKTVCYDENFAIKMFQSLNDRGLELSNSDIFKSWLYGKCDKDYRQTFNTSWKSLVLKVNSINVTMDDFIVFYEYYKIKANPKLTVVDELKDKLKDERIEDIISDLEDFMECVTKVFNSKNYTIFSLRYIPWNFYVVSSLASAFKVGLYDMDSSNSRLLKIMQKYFYIAFISGANVNTIKQTSFKLIEYIVDKREIEEIEELLNDFIYRKDRIAKVYDNINGAVYNERFLKPLMLSIDYEEHEKGTMQFIDINNKLHMDHILPKKYQNNNDWNYIENHDQIQVELNGIGNMALLQWFKNEKALNYGLKVKLNYYNGYEEDGVTKIKDENGKGATSFITTKKIIDEYMGTKKKWTLKSITERKKYLIGKIENLLDITEADKVIDFEGEERKSSSKTKWLYNGEIYNNKTFIKELLKKFIIDNKIKDFNDIPKELKTFQVYHRDFLSNDEDYFYKYYEKINGIDLYISSVYYYETTQALINYFKLVIDFEYQEIKNENIELHSLIRRKVLNRINEIHDNKYLSDEKNINKANTFIQFYKENWLKDLMHFELFCESKKWNQEKLNMKVELHLEKRITDKYIEYLGTKNFRIDKDSTTGANVAVYNDELISTPVECDFTDIDKTNESINIITNELLKLINQYEKIIDALVIPTKVYSTEDVERFLERAEDDSIVNLYNTINDYCMNLASDVKVNTTNDYIGYTRNTIFCELHIMKNRITCNIKTIDYIDPKNKVKYRDNVNWSNKNYISIYPTDDINYYLDIIKQSYESDKR